MNVRVRSSVSAVLELIQAGCWGERGSIVRSTSKCADDNAARAKLIRRFAAPSPANGRGLSRSLAPRKRGEGGPKGRVRGARRNALCTEFNNARLRFPSVRKLTISRSYTAISLIRRNIYG